MLGSPFDWTVLAVVALVVFGPKKLPELGKSLGQGLGSFKKALTDAQDDVHTAVVPEEKPASKPVEDEKAKTS